MTRFLAAIAFLVTMMSAALAGELHERHGKGPVVASNIEYQAIRIERVLSQALLGASLCCEFCGHLPIACRFTGMNNIVAVGTEDLLKSLFVILLGCCYQGIDRLLSGRETSSFPRLRSSLLDTAEK